MTKKFLWQCSTVTHAVKDTPLAYHVFVRETVPPEHVFETNHTANLPFEIRLRNDCDEPLHVLVLSDTALEHYPALKAALNFPPKGITPFGEFPTPEGEYTTPTEGEP